MQIKFYSFLLLLFAFTTTSCKKWLPENRIAGSWKLVDAEKRRLFSNYSFTTGYEAGNFSFYENGTATYSDGSIRMSGRWDMRNTNNGYYDQDGNWNSNSGTDLLLKLYDFRNNQVIEWYFDYIDFRNSGKRLIGFMQGANYNYRYHFQKQ